MFFKATDDELMERLGRGDKSSFRSLFDRHGAHVLGYCRRLMGDPYRGEDMAQAAWMRVIQAASSYRAEGKFLNWVLTLSRNICLSELRKTGHKMETPTLDGQEVEQTTVERSDFEQSLERSQTIAELKKKIEDLPEAQRIVISLWMNDELSYEEIADEVKMSSTAVKSLLFRARKSLEKAMRAVHEVV